MCLDSGVRTRPFSFGYIGPIVGKRVAVSGFGLSLFCRFRIGHSLLAFFVVFNVWHGSPPLLLPVGLVASLMRWSRPGTVWRDRPSCIDIIVSAIGLTHERDATSVPILDSATRAAMAVQHQAARATTGSIIHYHCPARSAVRAGRSLRLRHLLPMICQPFVRSHFKDFAFLHDQRCGHSASSAAIVSASGIAGPGRGSFAPCSAYLIRAASKSD